MSRDHTSWPDLFRSAPDLTLQLAWQEYLLIGSEAISWDPQSLWGDGVNSACTSCNDCPGKDQRHGPRKPWKLCGMDTTCFMIATKYRHKHLALHVSEVAESCSFCMCDASIITPYNSPVSSPISGLLKCSKVTQAQRQGLATTWIAVHPTVLDQLPEDIKRLTVSCLSP